MLVWLQCWLNILKLAQARSRRPHRSTLLHYVSANGVEDVRQQTPPNIVDIAKLLLHAGCDVHAESEAYDGGCTTLLLTATSCHPENAGVQLALLQLLIEHGATFGKDTITACLRNGRGQAAEFLVKRGSTLDLEAAAGTGQLEEVRRLLRDASEAQRMDGFAWACEFGHYAVVEYLLEQHPELANSRRENGQTGLHWAAFIGHEEIVRLLLQHGASSGAKESTWNGTALDWALYSGRSPEVVALLKGNG